MVHLKFSRVLLLASAALCWSMPTVAFGQTVGPSKVGDAAAAQTTGIAPVVQDVNGAEPANTGNDVVVTGSRIVRNGAQTPTPVTVLTTEEIQQRNPTNIADYLNQLPEFGIGNTPRTTLFFANATGGANQLNLRNLGVTRTLVLLDGRRVVGAGLIPSADINLLPQNLVSRVDVVTGGASAAYGSDAVAGVANFILDTRFTGLKGSVNYSLTDRGDANTITGDLAYGKDFGNGRAHLLLSGLYYHGDGVDTVEGRDWYRPGYHLITNPAYTAANGQPGQIARDDVGYNSTFGGVIASGPLRGIQFLPGGQTSPFVFSAIQQGQLQVGGTLVPTANRWPILPDEEHFSAYGRFNLQITDHINAIFEGSYAGNRTVNWSAVYNRQGTTAITVSRQNPFLPTSVQSQMDAAGVTSFTLNRQFWDMINTPGTHIGQAGYNRYQDRFLWALEGDFRSSGKWHAYYQRGHTEVEYTRDNNIIPSRFNLAIDAIANPAVGGVAGVAAGTPICRSRLTAPNNGCIPLNLFGEGSLGAAAIGYVTGYTDGLRTRQNLDFYQDVAAIDGQYEPFNTWAGPVSIAAGFEWRREAFSATADNYSYASLWNVGNFKPGQGRYNVKEFFGETIIPLLKDTAIAKSVDINGAVRRTDYSTSGAVTTWKAGLVWDFGGFRLRGTRSRDIRAPNLNDLFAPGSQFVNAYLDRTQTGSPQVPNFTISGGNPKLTPEIADTWTAGGVFQPGFIPGLTVSVDWFKIDIRDAIVALGAQTIIDQCYGFNRPQNSAACSSIVLAPGAANLVNATIYTGGINAQSQSVSGIDYEIGYRTDLNRISGSLPGALSLRLLVSQKLKDQTTLPGDNTPPTLGTIGSLRWTGLFTGTYAVGPSRTTITARYLGPGRLTNYPETSATGIAAADNHVRAVTYWELSENLDLTIRGTRFTVFGTVENLFDRDPEPVASTYLSVGSQAPYDLLGRTIRVGARFRL